MQVLRNALDMAPDHPEVLRPAGLCHMRAQRYDAAQAILQRGVAQWPDYALAHSDLGGMQSAMGAADAAFASWRRACGLVPSAPLPWFNLGRNLQHSGTSPHWNKRTR